MIRAIKWWGGSGTGETSALPGIALIGLPVLLVMLVLSGCGGDQKGGKMVYTSQEEGIQNIYLVDPGKNPLNLTDSPSKDSSPRLSPDGKMVAFVSERNGKRDVFIIDVKGQGLVQISDGTGNVSSPRWSPDGEMLAYLSTSEEGAVHIYLTEVEDPSPHRLTVGSTDEGPPAWSPDGRWIAFSLIDDKGEGLGIFLRNPGGVNQIPLTEGPDFLPSWAPDSKAIVFQSTRSGNDDIYVVDVIDENIAIEPRRLTNNPEADLTPTWSPDGKWIAFISERDGNPEIYLVSLDGTLLKRLTINEAIEEGVAWSEDGRLAFVSHLHGNADIFIMDSDGGNQSQITLDPGPDTQPHW